MDIASFIVLARVGTYGPHIIAALSMAAFVLYAAWKLRKTQKLELWQLALFIIFAWQFHEILSQIPLNLSHDTFTSYAFSGNWEISAILIGLGFYVLRSRMTFRLVPWLVFGAFIGFYSSLGWPITFPPSPQLMWVGLMENAYHVYFVIPFWSLFF